MRIYSKKPFVVSKEKERILCKVWPVQYINFFTCGVWRRDRERQTAAGIHLHFISCRNYKKRNRDKLFVSDSSNQLQRSPKQTWFQSRLASLSTVLLTFTRWKKKPAPEKKRKTKSRKNFPTLSHT